jgi:hypothetical protein
MEQTHIHQYGPAVYRGVGIAREGGGTVCVATGRVLGSPSFFYGSPAVVVAHAKYNAGRPGNVAPAPLVADPDGLPRRRA